jgi:hypothetical protein
MTKMRVAQELQRLCTECGERLPLDHLHVCRECLATVAAAA